MLHLVYSCKSVQEFFPFWEQSYIPFFGERVGGALMGLPVPTVAEPDPGVCVRTVGGAALLDGPDFPNGT